jgi:hypothetical protein
MNRDFRPKKFRLCAHSHETLNRLRNLFQRAIIPHYISMKARYPWSEGLIDLWRIKFSNSQNVEQWLTWSQLAWIEDLTTRQEPVFRQPKWQKGAHLKPCSLQPKDSWPLKNLCQATKRPNRGLLDAIFLWIEGHTTFEKSHFQAAKMPNRGTINTMGGGSEAPWVFLFANGITKNAFTKYMYL